MRTNTFLIGKNVLLSCESKIPVKKEYQPPQYIIVSYFTTNFVVVVVVRGIKSFFFQKKKIIIIIMWKNYFSPSSLVSTVYLVHQYHNYIANENVAKKNRNFLVTRLAEVQIITHY